MIQCPCCGHEVKDYFDHVAIECEHDMTKEEIEALLKEVELLCEKTE